MDAPTGVSVGLARAGDRAMLTALGALASFRAEDVPDEVLAARARWVHVASPFLQPGARTSRRSPSAAAGTTSLDPGWDPRRALGRSQWAGFDVLMPNAQEARRLAGEEATSRRRRDGSPRAGHWSW